jgi:hypothetical protein
MRQTASIFKTRGDNQRDLQEGRRAGDREASSNGNSQRVTKNDRLELVEGRSPPKRKKTLQIQVEPEMREHRPLHELQLPLLGE